MPKRVVRRKSKGPIDPKLGQKIRELRLARGMKQAELAGSDFTKGFISLLENGRTRPSLRSAEIIANRLGLTLAQLLGQPDHMPPVEVFADISARLLKLRALRHDPIRLVVELERLAAEARRLAQRRMVTADAVHKGTRQGDSAEEGNQHG